MSKPKRLFLMHIEKTGGTTLERHIRKNYREEKIFNAYSSEDWTRIDDKNLLLDHQLFIGHSTFDTVQHLDNNFYVCTVLRRPLDHCISTYNNLRLRKDSHKYEEFQDIGMTFERYLREVLPKDLNLGRHSQTIRLVGHLAYQHLWKVIIGPDDHDRRVNEISRKNLSRFDLIGFTENLQSFYDKLCADMGWKTETLASDNTASSWEAKGRRAIRKSQLSTDIINEIEQLYTMEKEIYDYARTLPTAVS